MVSEVTWVGHVFYGVQGAPLYKFMNPVLMLFCSFHSNAVRYTTNVTSETPPLGNSYLKETAPALMRTMNGMYELDPIPARTDDMS